jgi:serine/threonine protein kinase
MLTVDPNQRYTINDIKKHSWLMLNNSNVTDVSSKTQSIPNCQLTNAILDHAESLGYNRTQILRSVNGNSYDSDAAIWHLLLEKFQQTCQIDSKIKEKKNLKFFYLIFINFLDSPIPIEPVFNDEMNNLNNSDLARRSTAPTIFDVNNTELVYSAPNTVTIKIKENNYFIFLLGGINTSTIRSM